MQFDRCRAWTRLIVVVLVATSYLADAKKSKDKHKAVAHKQLPTKFTAFETLHPDARCRHCSPLLSVPWGDFPGSDTTTGCPADAWNSPGNEWVHCGLAGDWEHVLRHVAPAMPLFHCNFSRMLPALNWCWKPAHPACVVDAVSVLKTRNETVVYVGDSITVQIYQATEALLRDAFPNATTDCRHEFNATTANVEHCVKLPSGFRLALAMAKMDFANATLSVLLPEEAAHCRHLLATQNYTSIGTKWILRSDIPKTSCFEYSWVSILPHVDVIVVNYGLWNYPMEVKFFQQYDAMVGSIVQYIKDNFRGRRFVYRSTLIGHYETCKQPAGYDAPLSQRRHHVPPGQDDVYNFFPPVDYEHSWVVHANRTGISMQFVNVTGMYSQRIDGKVDCNHFCYLGPQFWAARIVLMSALA